MDIRVRHAGAVGIIELTGRLTADDQPGAVKNAVVDLASGGALRVLLDLSRVHYIDSTRLGEIIAAHVTMTRQGGRLRLVGTPGRILELLHLAGLSNVFERFDTIADASLPH